jgi:allantoate deiminase
MVNGDARRWSVTAGGPPIDAARVISDLRELDRRTGGPGGARRVCWTETWREARAYLTKLLAEIGVTPERDEAGNLWGRLGGQGPALAVGSHIDSVPAGGWLDGALGVMAGVGVLRAWAGAGDAPPATLALVDWADEEGARFGRSLFGSSAFSGTLDPEAVRELRDADGIALPDALAENGVDLDRVLEAGSRRDALNAYLELHIEQGPVLDAEGIATAAVNGCAGVERHRLTITGQASHAGTTPMELRRDAGLAAADAALRIEGIARERDGVATTGVLRLDPGIPTAVAGRAELVVDLRHRDANELAAMLATARDVAADAAGARECDLAEEEVWRIEPLAFDPALVEHARHACLEASGSERELTSGALHDAAEVSRSVPTAMVFVPSRAGLSHTEREDTSEQDLATGIEAFGLLANRVLAAR